MELVLHFDLSHRKRRTRVSNYVVIQEFATVRWLDVGNSFKLWASTTIHDYIVRQLRGVLESRKCVEGGTAENTTHKQHHELDLDTIEK